MDIEELRNKRKQLHEKAHADLTSVEALACESERVANIASNSKETLNEIDKEFERLTALNNTDIVFMLFSAMLQTMRWVMMPELKLPNMEESALGVAKEERLGANEKNHVGGIYDGKSSGAEYELSELAKYREKYPEQAQKSQDEFYKKKDQYRGWKY